MKKIREQVEELIQWSCEYPNRHGAYMMLMKLDRMLDAIGRDPDAGSATLDRIVALDGRIAALEGKLGRKPYQTKTVLGDRIRALESRLERVLGPDPKRTTP